MKFDNPFQPSFVLLSANDSMLHDGRIFRPLKRFDFENKEFFKVQRAHSTGSALILNNKAIGD